LAITSEIATLESSFIAETAFPLIISNGKEEVLSTLIIYQILSFHYK
jgi:hypothetical protein